MNHQTAIRKTIDFVKDTLAGAEGGHDWWHACRVWKLAKRIGQTEEADMFIVELGALLHDIADAKFNDGDEEIGPRKARAFLTSIEVKEEVIVHIEKIISNVSFRKRHSQYFRSPELAVIQDADRLDAMGAIGIARVFNYGGHKNRPIYDPGIKPNLNGSQEKIKPKHSSAINHFYEKLLLLKEGMNTKAGRSMAEARHTFMEAFLDQFYAEWEGEDNLF